MKIRIVLLTAVVLSAIGFGLSSYGETAVECKCGIPSADAAFTRSSNVFLGEVVSEEKNGDIRTFEFKVERYWKGKAAKTIKINVYENARYQAWFKTGERYLVYATANQDGTLSVGRCSRSNEAKNAAADLKKLGKGKVPRK